MTIWRNRFFEFQNTAARKAKNKETREGIKCDALVLPRVRGGNLCRWEKSISVNVRGGTKRAMGGGEDEVKKIEGQTKHVKRVCGLKSGVLFFGENDREREREIERKWGEGEGARS